MKRNKSIRNLLIVAIVLIFGAEVRTAYAQITFDHSYYAFHKDFYAIDLGNNDYKYVIQDSTGFSLYNLDYTLYLTVVPPIPIWVAPAYYQVAYISKTLFDCDSTNIEYALSQPGAKSNFYVYRTDGTLLFERDSVTGIYGIGLYDGSLILQPIKNMSNGTKLFLQDNSFANGGNYDSIYIYSLCGTLPESIEEISPNHNYVLVFPNPTDGIVNFQINNSNNQDEFKLTIYNSLLQKVDEATIYGRNYQLDVRQKSLSSGTYLFALTANNKVYQRGKFIITNSH